MAVPLPENLKKGFFSFLAALDDITQLPSDVLASGAVALNVGMRSGKEAGFDELRQRLAKIIAQIPTYAPGGANPQPVTSWSEVARTAGFPEGQADTVGGVMEFLAPNLPGVGKFKQTQAIVDISKAGADKALKVFWGVADDLATEMYMALRRWAQAKEGASAAEKGHLLTKMANAREQLDALDPAIRRAIDYKLNAGELVVFFPEVEGVGRYKGFDLVKSSVLDLTRKVSAKSGTIEGTVLPGAAEQRRRGAEEYAGLIAYRIPAGTKLAHVDAPYINDDAMQNLMKEGYDGVVLKYGGVALFPSFFQKNPATTPKGVKRK